jgi:hypothetical protein
MGTPLHMSLSVFASQLDETTVEPFIERPSRSSYSLALSRTSVYAPTPGSGQEKNPKSGTISSTSEHQPMSALTRDEPEVRLISFSIQNEMRVRAASSITRLNHKARVERWTCE